MLNDARLSYGVESYRSDKEFEYIQECGGSQFEPRLQCENHRDSEVYVKRLLPAAPRLSIDPTGMWETLDF